MLPDLRVERDEARADEDRHDLLAGAAREVHQRVVEAVRRDALSARKDQLGADEQEEEGNGECDVVGHFFLGKSRFAVDSRESLKYLPRPRCWGIV